MHVGVDCGVEDVAGQWACGLAVFFFLKVLVVCFDVVGWGAGAAAGRGEGAEAQAEEDGGEAHGEGGVMGWW
jgi:hypothetical protein